MLLCVGVVVVWLGSNMFLFFSGVVVRRALVGGGVMTARMLLCDIGLL